MPLKTFSIKNYTVYFTIETEKSINCFENKTLRHPFEHLYRNRLFWSTKPVNKTPYSFCIENGIRSIKIILSTF